MDGVITKHCSLCIRQALKVIARYSGGHGRKGVMESFCYRTIGTERGDTWVDTGVGRNKFEVLTRLWHVLIQNLLMR